MPHIVSNPSVASLKRAFNHIEAVDTVKVEANRPFIGTVSITIVARTGPRRASDPCPFPKMRLFAR